MIDEGRTDPLSLRWADVVALVDAKSTPLPIYVLGTLDAAVRRMPQARAGTALPSRRRARRLPNQSAWPGR